MLENIQSAFAQVQGLVVVDNGSNADELDPLRHASRNIGFHLIENGENLGIAEALNQGILWAQKNDYPWVVLFDQDSKLTDRFIEKMFETWESHPARERIGSIHPRYVDPVTGIEPAVERAKDGGPVKSLTSGALMPTWIFERIGGFASEYFIDFVDWEYCFRIRAAGYLVADSRQAILLHAPGEPTTRNILGHTIHLSNHSAIRRYYISRNSIVFYGKYASSLPGPSLSGAYGQFKDTIVCLLLEKDRGRKLRSVLLGTWDGLTGRMGKRNGI
jgi:rhamnosyltransferase